MRFPFRLSSQVREELAALLLRRERMLIKRREKVAEVAACQAAAKEAMVAAAGPASASGSASSGSAGSGFAGQAHRKALSAPGS